jgi:hypothetical protein
MNPRHFRRLPWSLDAQRGSTLRQIGKLPPPVSGRLFSISVFDTRRPVRELAETGSLQGRAEAIIVGDQGENLLTGGSLLNWPRSLGCQRFTHTVNM